MQVIKRDGSKVEFDAEKIFQAVSKAFQAAIGRQPFEPIANIVADVQRFTSEEMTVEAIQDIVERQIMKYNPEVAKAYILYREQRNHLRSVTPDPSAIADYIHASKYARYLPEKQRRETYEETVTRVKLMHKWRYKNLWPEIEQYFEAVYAKAVLPSMRSMQFAGRAIELHNARMYNCCFTPIDRPRAFSELMYLLLCGCGVGISVQTHHVKALPPIAKMGCLFQHHIIGDSIIGWTNAVEALIQGALQGYHVCFAYHHIRPEGAPLKTSGGRAPGHLPLAIALEECREILFNAQGRHLRPIECLDLCCHISTAVLAGGIRRSSMIALFSLHDEEMMYAKDTANFEFDGKNNQRALSNNSVVLHPGTHIEALQKIIELNKSNFGDPGFVRLPHAKLGVNPCGEILINPYWESQAGVGFCNLVEINLASDYDFYEQCKAASFIATLQAGYNSFPYLGKVTEAIAKRDAAIGVSLTGYEDCSKVLNLEEGRNWVRAINEETAELIGINAASRITCVKPSGTASLELGGVASGIHPHHAKRYFRRVTANRNETIAQEFRRLNPHMVEVKPDGDWCITFPMQAKHYTERSALEFIDRIKHVYEKWIDGHNISCTITVQEHEWDKVVEAIWDSKLISATFIPATSDKDIPYCPREAVMTVKDMEDWILLIKEYKPLDYQDIKEVLDTTVKAAACDGEGCEIADGFVIGTGQYINENGGVETWNQLQ
jgi:ribonucleoside-diphosphate reductase alpha chain